MAIVIGAWFVWHGLEYFHEAEYGKSAFCLVLFCLELLFVYYYCREHDEHDNGPGRWHNERPKNPDKEDKTNG